jgi:hypothetical protein
MLQAGSEHAGASRYEDQHKTAIASAMRDGSEILLRVCGAIEEGRLNRAAEVLDSEFPFLPLTANSRRYSRIQLMGVFIRDGFIDRYSGQRLIFPGTLRLLSHLLPAQFPFHTNWKTDSCHFAFYELFPTIDHVVPVSRGGQDAAHNWVCSSMLRNAAKANFTIEELGWKLYPPGDPQAWDGMTAWFLRQYRNQKDFHAVEYFRQWAEAAMKAHPAAL